MDYCGGNVIPFRKTHSAQVQSPPSVMMTRCVMPTLADGLCVYTVNAAIAFSAFTKRRTYS